MSFVYDAANRIITMLQGVSMTTYTYDPCGNKTLENLSGSITSYSYDGENRLLVRQDPSGTIITNTYQGSGLRRSTQDTGQAVSTMIWDGKDYLGQI
jgi:YD repeat-containing protein